jgi:hypothetical protein
MKTMRTMAEKKTTDQADNTEKGILPAGSIGSLQEAWRAARPAGFPATDPGRGSNSKYELTVMVSLSNHRVTSAFYIAILRITAVGALLIAPFS